MIYFRRVVEDSMLPSYRDGQIVLVSYVRNYKVGDVVVAHMDQREVIKRITKKGDGKVFLEGDNKSQSMDSRSHGWLLDRHVVAKVIWPRRRLLK